MIAFQAFQSFDKEYGKVGRAKDLNQMVLVGILFL